MISWNLRELYFKYFFRSLCLTTFVSSSLLLKSSLEMYFVQGKYSRRGKKIKGVGTLDFRVTATYSRFQGLLKFLLHNIKQSSFCEQATFIKKKYFSDLPNLLSSMWILLISLFFTVAIIAKFGETEESKTLKSEIGAWLRNFADREGGRKDHGIRVDQEFTKWLYCINDKYSQLWIFLFFFVYFSVWMIYYQWYLTEKKIYYTRITYERN